MRIGYQLCLIDYRMSCLDVIIDFLKECFCCCCYPSNKTPNKIPNKTSTKTSTPLISSGNKIYNISSFRGRRLFPINFHF
jgi:hypothetical protein